MAALAKLLLYGGLAAGAYYVATKAKGSPEGYGGTTPPDGVRQPLDENMLALYQSIIYGHGTPGDCVTLLEYIDHLSPENQAEEDWLAQVRADVTHACEAGAIPVASNPPTLPAWFPDALVTQYNDCWASLNCDIDQISGAMISIVNNYAGMVPSSQTQQANLAIIELQQRYASVSGKRPHVGDCGCAKCAAERVGEDEEPCCEACALKGVGACSCQQQEDERMQYTGGT